MTGTAAGLAVAEPAGWIRRGIERWWDLRDRWLANPLFRRRAAAFALTRPTARRHARELFDLVAGFVYSQVLVACVQLRLFEVLAEGPQPLEKLAARLGLGVEAARCLLDAAVALRLVACRRGGCYGLGERGAPMVGNAAVDAMVQHHAALYADLRDPVALLRASPAQRARNELARYWDYPAAANAADHARVGTYSALMSASQPLVAEEIFDAYALHRHRCLLDVGGGDGSFLISAAQRAPRLQLMLFDLPGVAERARARLSEAGLTHRATVCAGSFLDQALPLGADIVSLVRVIHDHDDAQAMTILRSVHAALPAGGTLLLAEPMADTKGAEAMGAAYFGFYLLAMGRGRPRSASELTRMLQAAGFDAVMRRPTHQPLQTQVLIARRP